ncbi:hypothetical protein LEP1GSC051_2288 [Leptospira sp. P2653]|nr:hypothetical protein LEP1GSC051_2288 [Leptospira sp. P2653]
MFLSSFTFAYKVKSLFLLFILLHSMVHPLFIWNALSA